MTFVCNANIGLTIGYRLLLVVSMLDIGTCQKPISVQLYIIICIAVTINLLISTYMHAFYSLPYPCISHYSPILIYLNLMYMITRCLQNFMNGTVYATL